MPNTHTQRQSRAAAWFQTPEARSVLVSGWPHLARVCGTRPNMPVLCVSAMGKPAAFRDLSLQNSVWLSSWNSGYSGDANCSHPWPLPSESIGTLVLHHVTDILQDREALFEDCHRVLLPGGQLFVFALNPLSLARRWWWRSGIASSEPSSLRIALRRHGFHCDTSTMGFGPTWSDSPDESTARGAGARAAYLLHAEKRVVPLTPIRAKPARRQTLPGLAK